MARVLIAGWAGCPFHAAAQRCLRACAPDRLEVKDFPDMAEFHNWLGEQGHERHSSPLCFVDSKKLGGYSELRAWLAEELSRKLEHQAASIALLSLQKHLQGRWLVDLRLALAQQGEPSEVFCIDADDRVWREGPCAERTWKIMINCVSDAAPAHVQRRLLAALADADARGVQVCNGIESFTACAGKVAQHALLRCLQLPSPKSLVVSKAAGERLAELAAGLSYPLLLKPNAGGFGHGIQAFATAEELRCAEPHFGEDGLALLQERHSPVDELVGRIWMLENQVLCAVLAPMMEPGSKGPSGCMADGRAAVAARAWKVPKGLQADCERILQAAKASWGSIEVMCAQGQWLFFDLNLSCMSTMPDPALIADPEQLWPAGFDPYARLAAWIQSQVEERPSKAARG